MFHVTKAAFFSIAPRRCGNGLGAKLSQGHAVLRQMSSAAASKNKVGFIGLGNMGSFMAQNLMNAGHQLVVYDVVSDAVKRLEEKGAEGATSAEEVTKETSHIISMLPSSPHVRDLYQNHIFEAATPGSLFIDCSTIDPNATTDIAAIAAEKKFRMVDAPVSGGVRGAEQATLTFMVGGSAEDYEEAKTYLSAMGKNYFHCGAAGTGQIAKLCNNLILGISMMGVSEAMNLGKRLGADPKVLSGIINVSSGRCWASDSYNPVPGVMEGVPSARNYEGGFGTALMQKDLGLAGDAAKSVNAPLPLGGAAYNMYNIMNNAGYGKKDFGSVYKYLSGDSGEDTNK
eukprot:gb/GECG01015500.1/.p1 GENE.gb/GECG01015500.1/~~gb/GECG01015500.1/.p1  ORF type:complete len:342 (+),score=48.80 gb/GECG01015500.1/:1-1026(+)